jgi:hypothetical protein
MIPIEALYSYTFVTVLHTGFPKDMFMQSCLREIYHLAAVNGFEVRVRHIVGVVEALYSYTFQQHKHEKQTSYIVVREFLIPK